MNKDEIALELCNFLTEMEARQDVENQQAIKNRFVTTMVMRTTLAVMVAIAVANVFLLDMLKSEISSSLVSVDHINKDFTTISQKMQSITVSVNGIDQHIGTLSPIASNMNDINNNMSILDTNINSLTQFVDGIENDIQHIDGSMYYVDYRVHGVSNDIQHIGHSMHKVSAPMRMMGMFMP